MNEQQIDTMHRNRITAQTARIIGSVTCPKCGHNAGQPCSTPSGFLANKPHPARVKASGYNGEVDYFVNNRIGG